MAQLIGNASIKVSSKKFSFNIFRISVGDKSVLGHRWSNLPASAPHGPRYGFPVRVFQSLIDVRHRRRAIQQRRSARFGQRQVHLQRQHARRIDYLGQHGKHHHAQSEHRADPNHCMRRSLRRFLDWTRLEGRNGCTFSSNRTTRNRSGPPGYIQPIGIGRLRQRFPQ